MDARGGRARHRHSRRAAEEGRRDFRQAEALGVRLVHGRHPAHGRHGQRARLLQPVARHRQCRHLRRRRQHLPRPLQRAGRDRYRSRYHFAAALLRPGRRRLAALGPRLGRVATTICSRASTKCRRRPGVRRARRSRTWSCRAFPWTRWFDATLAKPEDVDQKRHRQGRGRHGPRRQHHPAHDRDGEGPGGARAAGRRRSASDHVRGDLQPQERHLPVAGLHAVRNVGLAHGVEPLAAVGRADRQADLRIEGRLRDHLPPVGEARLRRPDVQEHQGREQAAGAGGPAARDQPRRLLDRLFRPVAGAAEGAHEEPGQVRPGDAARQGRRAGDRRRLLRPAVAVLGHAGRSSIRARIRSTTPTCM